jgi:hypothetical protein
MSWAYQPLLPATPLLAQTPPTTALNSPADTANTGDLTPTLNFTGTDAQSDEVEYNVQVATSSSFSGTISGSNLTSGTADAGAFNDVTTASISPTSNNLVLLAIALRNAIGTEPTTPTVSGNGLTWVLEESIYYDTAPTSVRKLFVFRAMGSSPSSGTVVITFGEEESAYAYCIDQFSGVDTSGTNGSGAIVQSVPAKDETPPTSLTVTLSAFSNANNATYGAFAESNGYVQSAGSGFTELASPEASVQIGALTEWKSGEDTSVDYSITSASGVGGIAIEIKALAPLIDAYSATDAGFTGGVSVATPTNLTKGGSTTDATSIDTASVTFTANRLYILTVNSRTGITADPNQPTATGGNVTWVVPTNGSEIIDTTSASRRRLTLLYGICSSTTSGAVTIDFGGQSQETFGWIIDEIASGFNATTPVVQAAKNNSQVAVTSVTATLAAFGSSYNATYGVAGFSNGTITSTAGSGFTLVTTNTDAGGDGNLGLDTEFRATNDTTVDVSFASDAENGIIGIEIKAKHPFSSGDATDYTVQSDLTASTTYYWRARAIDPAGSNTWGAWSSTRSFVATTGSAELTVSNSSHSHSSDSPTLTQKYTLSVDNATHGHSSGNITLTQKHTLSVDNSSHDHSSENITLVEDFLLTVSNSSHDHSSENVVLTQKHTLAVDNASNAHSSETPTLTQKHTLEVNNSSHAHTADSATLTQKHTLSVDNASHGHSVENISLTQKHTLSVENAAHAHSSETVTLTQKHTLSISTGSHSLSSDSPTLTQKHTLSVDNASHVLTSDEVTLSASLSLIVSDASHGHTVENVDITQKHTLAVSNGLHGHSAEEPTLLEHSELTVNNASHAHTAESVVLDAEITLSVDPGSHGVTSDSLTLTQKHTLTVENSSHSITSDLVVLVVPDVWTTKTKVAAILWDLKDKTEQIVSAMRILTPDNNQILVGENENLVLTYEEGYELWQTLTKQNLSWDLKTKTNQVIGSMKIVTPDGNYILVGENENEILTYQAISSVWEKMQKEELEWELKTKINK